MPSIIRRATSFFKKPEKSEFRLERRAATQFQRKSVDSIHNTGSETNLTYIDPNRSNAWSKGYNGVPMYVGKPKRRKTRVLDHDPINMSPEDAAKFLKQNPHIAPEAQLYPPAHKILRLSNPDLRADGHPVRSSSLYKLKDYSTESLLDPPSGISTPGLSTSSSSTISSTFTSPMSSTENLLELTLSHFDKPQRQFLLPESLQCESPTAEIFPHYDSKRLSDIPEGKFYQPRIEAF